MRRRKRRAVTVVLHTRAGCGLCLRAKPIVLREARGCTVTVIDIDSSDALLTRYALRIPVISVDGNEVAEGELQPGVVRAAVRAALRQQN